MAENNVKMLSSEDLENKRVFLQLLQEPISRMSSTSAVFKGFSAAVLAGLASASFTDISFTALLLGLIPILSFLCLDLYYLGLERKFRLRYKQVAEGRIETDFRVNLKLTKSEKKEARSSAFRCLLSPSIWLFYFPIISCAVLLLVFKAIGLV